MRKIKRIFAVAIVAALIVPIGAAPEAVGRYDFRDLKKVPKPKVTGKEIITGLEEYVTKFPLRQNGLPGNDGAAAFLAKEAKKYGFKVVSSNHSRATAATRCWRPRSPPRNAMRMESAGAHIASLTSARRSRYVAGGLVMSRHTRGRTMSMPVTRMDGQSRVGSHPARL